MCVTCCQPRAGLMMHDDNTTPRDKLEGGSESCLGGRRACATTALKDQMAVDARSVGGVMDRCCPHSALHLIYSARLAPPALSQHEGSDTLCRPEADSRHTGTTTPFVKECGLSLSPLT